MRISCVLAPVDFSAPSQLAVDYAVALARQFRATLRLLHVVELPAVTLAPHEADDAARKLSALVTPEDKGDLDVQTIVKTGDILDRILETVHEQNSDLVVLGTHGRGLFGRALIGSITHKMLRRLNVPVFTVCHVTGPLKLERILFATDLSEDSESAFRFALDMARALGRHLMILHAIDYVGLNFEVADAGKTVREQLFDMAKSRLHEMAVRAEREDVEVETALVQGDAATQILAFADKNETDLILLSIQRKGLLEKALLGSTAERVIRDAYIPVLSIPVTGADSGMKQRAS